MKAARLVVLADVGGDSYHVGDEATAMTNVRRLAASAPDARITVLARSAGASEVATALGDATGVLISGGGNLSSSWPALLAQRILVAHVCARHDIPIVFGGQTLGPELSAAHRHDLSGALGGVRLLGVRDLPSAELAAELGVMEDRIGYQVDDAFLLAAVRPRRASLGWATRRPYLAVTLDASFAAPRERRRLESLTTELARFASGARLRVILIPHLGPLGALDGEDGSVAHAIREVLLSEGVGCTLAPVLRANEVVWLTGRAAAIVSSRFHPLVFGLAAAIPCLALHRDRYTRIKLEGALSHLGMQAWSMSLAEAEAGSLAKALGELWRNREQISAAMQAALPVIESRERRRWHHVMNCLGLLGGDALAHGPPPLGWPTAELAWAAASEATQHMNPPALARRASGQSAIKTGAPAMLEENSWQQFRRDGFLHLGAVLEPDQVDALRQRADDLALGRVHNEHVLMQLDTGGDYDALPDVVSEFDQGTLLYRKIQGLERDELFRPLVVHPLFLEICGRMYAPHAPISIFRAMIMNKPAGQGTLLPWHQDGGSVWQLDRDPLVTIWVALDEATVANGCMEAVVGSHRKGLVTAEGSTLSPENAQIHCDPALVVPLEVESGHAVLLHNWLIHRSGVNRSSAPRRAFTGCYMDGRCISVLTGDHFPIISGTVDEAPYPYVGQLEIDRSAYAESFRTAEEYAHSLEFEVTALRERCEIAETYARSLEIERERRHQGRTRLPGRAAQRLRSMLP